MRSPGPDLALIQRLRWRYELARLRRGLVGVLPILAMALVAISATHRPWAATAFGLGALAVGAGFLWYGREPQRAVLPAIAAGLVPLTLALCANHVHSCGIRDCATLCLTACVVGGVVAGLAIGGVVLHRDERSRFWLAASGLTLLVGAMGSSCVGGAGVVGLLGGFAAGTVPGLFNRALGRS